MISITEEKFTLSKLSIYYKENSDKHIDVYVRFPEEFNESTTSVCLFQMETYISNKTTKGDISGIFDCIKRFMFENNFKYYEVYKIG